MSLSESNLRDLAKEIQRGLSLWDPVTIDGVEYEQYESTTSASDTAPGEIKLTFLGDDEMSTLEFKLVVKDAEVIP